MLEFYRNMTFNKLFWIFFIGCFFGVVIETLWCFVRNKRFESRKGLVYGPFNLVYGFGAVLMTLSLSWLEGQRDIFIFLGGTFVGGVYEYMCSYIQEKLFGSVSWDYKNFSYNLNGRINLLYCIFWGILGLVWVKDTYPKILRLIDKIPSAYENSLVIICLVFMIFNIFVSYCVVYRMNERKSFKSPKNKFWKYIDKHYPDEKVTKIYPNMMFFKDKLKKTEE